MLNTKNVMLLGVIYTINGKNIVHVIACNAEKVCMAYLLI